MVGLFGDKHPTEAFNYGNVRTEETLFEREILETQAITLRMARDPQHWGLFLAPPLSLKVKLPGVLPPP